MSTKVYEIVTDRVCALLEKGVVPWRKPWAGGEAPKNLVSGKEYRGINPFLLACSPYASPFWATYKQVHARGGNVRKGEKASLVVFWKWLEKPDRDNPDKLAKIPLLRYYRVFNLEQTEGVRNVPESTVKDRDALEILQDARALAEGYQDAPKVQHVEARAYYRPSTDTVNMPRRETFTDCAEYYSTLFHELAHSTGHEKRLNRKGIGEGVAAFGGVKYSKEELIAEMGAAFLCGVAGIADRTVENSAAYLAGWLKRMKEEPKLVVQAAAAGQKAADYIRGVKFSD